MVGGSQVDAGSWVLLGGVFMTGVLNYVYTLLLVYLLAPTAFAQVASIASLLLLVGAAASSTIPWVLAREVANTEPGSDRRRSAIGAATVTALCAGAAAAGVVGLLESRYADRTLLAASGVACLSIFLSTVAVGYLQGSQRFRALALFRLVEVCVRFAAGIGLVLLNASAVAGVLGFTAGGVLCVGYGAVLIRGDLPRLTGCMSMDRSLWRHGIGIGLTQGLVGCVQALDSIALGVRVGSSPGVGSYQAMLTLARVPLFVSTALSIVAFARLASAQHADSQNRTTVKLMLRTYFLLAAPVAAVVVTAPDPLLILVLPDHYVAAHGLLLPLTVAGVSAGLLSLCASFFLAAGRYRELILTLAAGTPPAAVLLFLATPDLETVAWTAAASVSGIAAAVLTLLLARRRGLRLPAAAAVAIPAAGLLLGAARGNMTLWVCVVLLVSTSALVLLLRPAPAPQTEPAAGTPGDVLRTVVRRAARDRRGRPGRVILIGNYGNGNTGDESILAGLLGLLDERRRVTVVSRNPAEVSGMHDVPAVRTTSLAAVRALLRADAVCIGGGGMFGRGLPPLVRLLPWIAVAAQLSGKELYFLSIGAYADTPPTTKWPLQFAARLSTALTARDPETARTLSSGPARGRTVAIVPDPSVLLRPAPPERVDDLLCHRLRTLGPGRPLVVNVKAMPAAEELTATLEALAAALAAWAVRSDSPIVFLAMSTAGDYGLGESASDRRLADRVIELGGLTGRSVVLGPNLDPGLAKGICREAAAVVAMRLHTQIFATTSGTTLLGISFEPKSRLWLAQHGADELAAEGLSAAAVTSWLVATMAGSPPGDRGPNAQSTVALNVASEGR